ncbi:MAG: hypothetical protein IIB95_04415, partial [Candidatus Marinimicrobia bacterium]|nr:hypothetical protein [Candidatus Neomarinimicrobiota bacterium]
MTENNDERSSYSPDKLLTGFIQSRFVTCLIIAVAIHGVIFAATSVHYRRYQLDPEGAERRKAEAAAQQAATISQEASAIATKAQAAVTSAVTAAAGVNGGAKAG